MVYFSLFLSMCLFVFVNCLLNEFAICVSDVTVLSARVIVLLLYVWHSGWCVCVSVYIRDQLTNIPQPRNYFKGLRNPTNIYTPQSSIFLANESISGGHIGFI